MAQSTTGISNPPNVGLAAAEGKETLAEQAWRDEVFWNTSRTLDVRACELMFIWIERLLVDTLNSLFVYVFLMLRPSP